MHAQTYRDFQAYPHYLVTFRLRAAHVPAVPPARWQPSAPALAPTALSANAFDAAAYARRIAAVMQNAQNARTRAQAGVMGGMMIGGMCYQCGLVGSHTAACPLAAALLSHYAGAGNYGTSSATGGGATGGSGSGSGRGSGSGGSGRWVSLKK